MSITLVGPKNVAFERDDVGHRTYTVDWLVRISDPLDGPEYILSNWPLAAVGSTYSFGNDADPWAYCLPSLNISPHRDVTPGDPIQDYIITQKWSTNPTWRCQTAAIENPLLEPFQLSGDFVHEQRTPDSDRFGKPLIYPNFERIEGQYVEQKYSYPSISITFNSATLPLSTYVLLVNKVNDAPLWGLPPRCVRFIDAKWERLVYGTCFYYFRTTYTFEFDINTFDREIPAFGNLVLRPGGDPQVPTDYIQYQDSQGENAVAPLTSTGEVAEDPDDQAILRPQVAKEGNLLLLGIPSTLN